MSAKTVGELVVKDRKQYYPTSEGWQYLTLEGVAGIPTCTLKNNLTNGMPDLYEFPLFKRCNGEAFVIVRRRQVPEVRPFKKEVVETT